MPAAKRPAVAARKDHQLARASAHETQYVETADEDESHLGLAGPKKVLWFVCNLVLRRNGRSTSKRSLPVRGETMEVNLLAF